MVKQLNIKTGLLKNYYTPGHTRNETNFSNSPAQFFQLTHTYSTIRLVCEKVIGVLEERPTFPFTVENSTYSKPTKCQISIVNLSLVMFVVGDIRATGIKCFCC